MEEHDRLAEQTGWIDSDDYRSGRTGQMLAILPARQVIGRERGALEFEQRIEVGESGAPKHRVGRR